MMHLCLRVYRICLPACQPSVLSVTKPTLSARCGPTLLQSKTETLQAVLSDQVAALLGDEDPEEISYPRRKSPKRTGKPPPFL